jgi:hypothetical protein
VAAKGPGPGPGPGGNGPNNPVVIPGGNTGAQIAYSQALPGPRQTFALVGTIESIDDVSMTLTINVINGNKLVRDSGLTQVTVSVVETTRYLLKSCTIITPITFENLEVGQPVSLNGIVTVDENEIETWTAYRVTVGAYLTQTHKR